MNSSSPLLLPTLFGLLLASAAFAATPPTQISPANGTTNAGINVMLDWANLSGATGYDYEVYSGTTLVASNTNGPITSSYVRLNLAYETSYKWRVRGRVLPQNNPWSGYWTVATELVPTPKQSSPASGSTIAAVPVTLAWSAVSAANGYDYELWDGGTMIAGYGITYSGGPYMGTTVQCAVTYGKTYTWRVRARVLPQNNPWTNFWAFNTPPPPMPAITAPANGALIQSNTFTLSWSSVPEADGYDFEVTDNGTVVAGYGINYSGGPYRSTSVTLTLQRGKTYQCRVRARVLPQNNPWTNPQSVTLQVAAPSVPVITNIAQGAVVPLWTGLINVQTVSGLTFELHLVRLNDGVEVHNASGFTAAGGAIAIPKLSAGARYRIQLRASNAGGTSPYTSIDFSAAGLATPSGVSFTMLDADETGKLVASPVDGAESYEITISGPATGVQVYASTTPSLTFDLDEDSGSIVTGSIIARAAFSTSAAATVQAKVSRPAAANGRTQWGPTIETNEGSNPAPTISIPIKSKETVTIQRHNFGKQGFDDKASSVFTVAPGTAGNVVATAVSPAPSHSGLYRILWTKNAKPVGSRQFYYRVLATSPSVPVTMAAIDNAKADMFSGFQFVGLTKATDATYKTLQNWFHSGAYKDFNLEIECAPITFYHPLRPEAKGFENTVHPMDSVYRLVSALYPSGKTLRAGKLRIEVDLFFAHRDDDTEYRFDPTSNGPKSNGAQFKIPKISQGMDYTQFSPAGTPKGGDHFRETMRRADMLADCLKAISSRTDLVGKLDFVICIELEDELGRNWKKGGIDDMTNAFQEVAKRLAARGIGQDYGFPLHFRRVFDAATSTRERLNNSASKEHHDAPVKTVNSDFDKIFDSTLVQDLLAGLAAGDSYSDDGDGDMHSKDSHGKYSVPVFFTDDEFRQLYGLNKAAKRSESYSGLVQKYLAEGISLKPWRLAMNVSPEQKKSVPPRDRSKVEPFKTTSEALLLRDFLTAVSNTRALNPAPAKTMALKAFSTISTGPGTQAAVSPGFSILAATNDDEGPVTLPLTVGISSPGLVPAISGNCLFLYPASMPSLGAMLEGSSDFRTWQQIGYIRPDNTETVVSLPSAGQGFVRLVSEDTPPNVPTALSACLNEGSVCLEWTGGTGALPRFYVVERSAPNQAWLKIDTLYTADLEPGSAVTARDSSAPDGAWVSYRVSAFNSAGGSAPCASAQVWIPSRPPAFASLVLAIGGPAGPSPVLSWMADPLGIAAEAIVERAAGDAEFSTIASTLPNEPFTDDEELAPGIYRYRVLGRNQSGVSPPSQEVQFIVP